MHRIAVVGAGHVGLVTAACFAELGNGVVCIDTDYSKIKALQSARIPFYEPGLVELVQRNTLAGRLSFSENLLSGLHDADMAFITVGTPVHESGSCDLTAVRQVARDIARYLDHDVIVVNKSTVPVETGDLVDAIIREHSQKGLRIRFVCNPEFTREGSAIADFMNPERIVLGVTDESAVAEMRELYATLNAPIIVTDVRTAEMIKCTANAFLAMKISFVNEIAAICGRVGANIADVVAGTGADSRIGAAFFNAGLGFGGSCLPKDAAALARVAERCGVPSQLLPAVLAINEAQISGIAGRLEAALHGLRGMAVTILGLAFKPETDDVRESPAIKLARALLARGASVTAHDPVAIANARAPLGDRVRLVPDAYEAVRDADAVVVATEWQEYVELDLSAIRELMRGNVLMDARNALDARRALALGFHYCSVGRADAVPSGLIQTPAGERACIEP